MPVEIAGSHIFATTAPATATAAESPRAAAIDAELNRLRWENQASAALLELVGQVSLAEDLPTAGMTLVSGLQQHLGVDRVALGVVGRGSRKCKLLAISGMSEFDRNSPLARALQSAIEETAWSESPRAWSPAATLDNCTTLATALSQLAAVVGTRGLSGQRLQTADGTLVGVWLMWGDPRVTQASQSLDFAHAASSPLAAALDAAGRAARVAWLRPIRRRLASYSLRVTLCLGVAAVCGILALPWQYKIGCEAELQPVTRRFVQAPFAGLFEKSLVKPGDFVHRNQVLGRLDGRELRIEAASLEADANRAARSREANMAVNKTAAAQMDKLEMDRLEMKRQLLACRASQLDITSPLDGLVIAGDLEKSQGAPLSVGQSLYEIAPLDRMVLEVAIPVEEISHVRNGCEVTISLDAYPGQSWTATLLRVQPRAEVREADNVFIGEVELDNAAGQLRPGLKGRVKLLSDSRALGWIALHKPWNRLMAWLGI